MSKIEALAQQTSEEMLMASKKNRDARTDRKAWKNKLKRKQRRHKMW